MQKGDICRMNNEKVLLSLGSYLDFLETLRKVENGVDEIPLKEGKWSVKQIISHMYRWDLYLIEMILPAAIKDKAVHFPSHDNYNAQSEVYAKTVTFQDLINQSAAVRKKLIEELDRSQLMMDESITVNGLTHCPNTGTPYSLNYLMSEFIDHDRHHIQQIQRFLTLCQTN
jgi:uncharacterized damage-inducible protein DinB